MSVPALAELCAPIADRLAAVEGVITRELASEWPFVNELVEHVGQYRGKMLRPTLLLLSGKAAGELTDGHVVLAAVVELVHTATLVHDDVLDEADVRRRCPTVNRLWGNEASVLLGDFLISHAFHLCSSLNSGGLDAQTASRRIGWTTNQVCEGELMQIHHRGDVGLSEAEYLSIIERKTAVLCATSCELGAWASGADDRVVAGLRRYGQDVGTAFQIVDDMLDLAGDPEQMGKSLGTDVEKTKPTLPVIHYLGTQPADAGERFASLFRSGSRGDREQIRAALEASGSLAYAARAARGYVESAQSALAPLPDGEARDALTAVAEFVLLRGN